MRHSCSVCRLIYSLLMRLIPRQLRETYGAEMEDLFAVELDDARDRGWLAVLRVCMAGAFDLVRRAPYEHWRRRGRTGPHEISLKEPKMSSLVADLRFAIRSFSRQPGATALVVFTLV